MISISHLLVDGFVISIILSVLVLVSVVINPRIWISDMPAHIRAALPPLNATEKRQRAIFGVLLIGGMIGSLLLSAWRLRNINGGQLSFGAAWLHMYGLFTTFNLWDTIVIDWIVLSTFQPRWAVPPGAENMPGLFPTAGDNVRAFAKGLLIGVVFCLPLALVATL